MANTNIYPYGQSQEMPTGYPIANDLNTNSAQQALSAAMGKQLNEELDSLTRTRGSGFVDFGVMPSCLASDANNFLPDGLVGSNATDGSNYQYSGVAETDYPAALVKYADVIAKYDALVSAYPAYVSKHELGYDASGTIMIYYYTFKPKYYSQHAYLQAGVHGWEPDGVFALAEIMYLISNAYGGNLSPKIANNKELMYLRGNVAFTVVPCVNPHGFNNRSICLGTSSYLRQVAGHNANDAELNTNWDQNQAENVNIKTLLTSISNEISFAFDFHTSVSLQTRTKYGCFYGGVNSGCPITRSFFRTFEWLYEFYNVKYHAVVAGDTVPSPKTNGASIWCSTTGNFDGWCWRTFGIPAGTVEHTDHVWNDAGDANYPTQLHTSAAMSVAVNTYLNHILQQAYMGYNVDSSTDVPAGDKYNGLG